MLAHFVDPNLYAPAFCIYPNHSTLLQLKHQRRHNEPLRSHHVIFSTLSKQHFGPTPTRYRPERGSSRAVQALSSADHTVFVEGSNAQHYSVNCNVGMMGVGRALFVLRRRQPTHHEVFSTVFRQHCVPTNIIIFFGDEHNDNTAAQAIPAETEPSPQGPHIP